MADGSIYLPGKERDGLPASNLVARARRQSIFSPDADTSWLTKDMSAVAAEYFAARHFGNQERQFGGVLETTHFAESAIIMWNLETPDLARTDPAENAWIIFGHDLMEALAKHGVTEEQIVRDAWRGDPSREPFLLDRLKEFTESPNLTKPEKLLQQVLRAHQSDSPVYAYGRFAEKLATFRRDLWSIRNGRMIFSDQEIAEDYINNKLLPRKWVVGNLPIEDRYKNQFSKLTDDIQTVIARQLRPNPVERFVHAASSFAGRLTSPKTPETDKPSLIQLLQTSPRHA